MMVMSTDLRRQSITHVANERATAFLRLLRRPKGGKKKTYDNIIIPVINYPYIYITLRRRTNDDRLFVRKS